MEQYVIKGGNPLVGEVEIGGAKNAALAILSAAVMTDETVTIENLPNVRDINVLLNAIQEIGAKVDRIDAHTVKINGSFIRDFNVVNESQTASLSSQRTITDTGNIGKFLFYAWLL